MEYNNNDVFSWKYTNKDGIKDYAYWCKSQICIYKDGVFTDTYWGNSNDNKIFTEKDIDTKITLTLLGNFNDYRKAQLFERAWYLDKDCMNLNHANSSRDNFYIRKDAVKNLDKMKRVLKRKLRNLENDIEYAQSELRRAKKELEEMTIDNNLYVNNDVELCDSVYNDEDYIGGIL